MKSIKYDLIVNKRFIKKYYSNLGGKKMEELQICEIKLESQGE